MRQAPKAIDQGDQKSQEHRVIAVFGKLITLSDPSSPRTIFLPILFLLVLVIVVLVFPPLAAVVTVVAPAPIIFLYLQWGRVPGLVLMGAIFLVLLGLMGSGPAITFFAEYAVMAILLAEAIRMRLGFEKCIFFSALGASLLTIVFLFVQFSDREDSQTDFFQKQIEMHFQQSLESLESVGESPADLEAMKEFAERSSQTLASAYPAFIMVGSLIAAAVNYALVHVLWVRLYGPAMFHPGRFSEWVFPEALIWALILSGVATFFIGGTLGTLGMNVLVVMLVLYFFYGMAIIVYFLEARKVPIFVWVIIFFLIFIQPIFMGLAIGLGVFDLWADFRKLRKKTGENAG